MCGDGNLNENWILWSSWSPTHGPAIVVDYEWSLQQGIYLILCKFLLCTQSNEISCSVLWAQLATWSDFLELVTHDKSIGFDSHPFSSGGKKRHKIIPKHTSSAAVKTVKQSIIASSINTGKFLVIVLNYKKYWSVCPQKHFNKLFAFSSIVVFPAP